MAEVEEIEYTSEELAEIERIVDVIEIETNMKTADSEVVEESEPQSEETTLASPLVEKGEPDDLELPGADFSSLEIDESLTDEIGDIDIDDENSSLDISSDDLQNMNNDELLDDEELSIVNDLDENLDIDNLDLESADLSQITSESIDNIDEIEDITNIIHEVSEDSEDISLDESFLETPEAPEIPEILEDVLGESSISADKSPMEQLEELTADEPESIDKQEIDDSQFLEEDKMVDEISDESDTDLDDMEFEALEDISLDDNSADDIDADITDIEDLENIGSDDLTDIDINLNDIEDIDPDSHDIGNVDDIEIEPLDNLDNSNNYVEDENGLELTEDEFNRLKKIILLFNPSLISVIKETIVDDLLPPKETRQLVNLILTNKPENNIHRFLEKKLNKKINKNSDSQGRKVITSRPEYTKEGIERQKKLFFITKIIAAFSFVSIIIFLLAFNFIYKPWKAKTLIEEGVVYIVKDSEEKPKDYIKAEKIFQKVENEYIKNYIYGYNRYGQAYLQKKEYSVSVKKFNQAYKIDRANVAVLNNLGNYYSKVNSRFYKTIKSNIYNLYYKDKQLDNKNRNQLEVAIDFYRWALRLDKENIKALVGIGDVYFSQNRYSKAQNFYRNILKVDSSSIAGYSGLLNLYIESDSFVQLSQVHAEISEKDLMHKLPSALLSKLAGYYLSKIKTEKFNVRVDYGYYSTKMKDEQDNLYPAVRLVLKDLNKRDSNYPPMFLQSARLNYKLKNYIVMKRYLDKALKLEPNYFDALNLMGQYYYQINDPVKAHEYLKKSIDRYNYQPSFTREQFYKQTEQIGKSYALIGNIFYYFFDKIDFVDTFLKERVDDDYKEKLENYVIASQKYEKALSLGYQTSEIHYNLGRIHYLNQDYKSAVEEWLNLYEDFIKNPDLMLSLGNSFYHMGNYEASKGEYFKIISIYEVDADKISVVQKSSKRHVKIFNTLSSTYNNIGAIYQIQRDEGKSSVSYWKAIDYSKRVGKENEVARVNLGRSFKGNRKVEPILDEKIPFSIDYYRKRFHETK